MRSGLPATCPLVPCNGRRVALAQARRAGIKPNSTSRCRVAFYMPPVCGRVLNPTLQRMIQIYNTQNCRAPGPDPPATRLPDVGQGWRAGLTIWLYACIHGICASRSRAGLGTGRAGWADRTYIFHTLLRMFKIIW